MFNSAWVSRGRHVQVIGAGLGGLSAALFLARRRVRVTIFEQDEMAPPQDTEGCF
jgi:phytoene dehydrogenase-like protein